MKAHKTIWRVKLDRALVDQLDAMAERHGTTVPAEIAQIVRTQLEKTTP